MSKIRFELNRAGVRELMKSAEMTNVLRSYADAAAGRLGDGYVVTTRAGETRANAEVAAVSRQARRENAENNTILKALGL